MSREKNIRSIFGSKGKCSLKSEAMCDRHRFRLRSRVRTPERSVTGTIDKHIDGLKSHIKSLSYALMKTKKDLKQMQEDLKKEEQVPYFFIDIPPSRFPFPILNNIAD